MSEKPALSLFPVLVLAAHPEATLAVTSVSLLLAASLGQSGFDLVLIGLAVLASQLSTGWGNDFLDYPKDAKARRGDKPLVSNPGHLRAVGFAALAAAVFCCFLSLSRGVTAGSLLISALFMAHWYNLRLKATVLSFLPYLWSFAALPAFVILACAKNPSWQILASGSLLGLAAHFANVLPDIQRDRAEGIRGLPQRLGAKTSRNLLCLFLLLASALLAVGQGPDFFWFGLVVLGLALLVFPLVFFFSRKPESRLPFRLLLVVVVADVALLFAAGSSL